MDNKSREDYYWYGIRPYNEEQLKESKESWSYIKETKEEFIVNVANDADYIGILERDKFTVDFFIGYLSAISDNMLYAIADFVDYINSK